MRNLKRVLSLALALVMILGMMVMGAGAASTDFGDSDEIINTAAVDVMNAIGVISGDGTNFYPERVLNRAEAAKIICYMLMGPEKAVNLAGTVNTTEFTDVPATAWYAPYVSYCANLGIISGDGEGHFFPAGELNGIAFGKMLLIALGYNPVTEGYVNNPSYVANIMNDMIEAGIYVSAVSPVEPLSRDYACQMGLLTLEATMVEYNGDFNITTSDGTTIKQNVPATNRSAPDYSYKSRGGEVATSGMQFCERYFPNLKLFINQEDDYGNAAEIWFMANSEDDYSYTAAKSIATVKTAGALGTYTDDMGKITYGDLYTLTGDNTALSIYENGNDASLTVVPVKGSSDKVFSGNNCRKDYTGALVEIVDNEKEDGVAETVLVTYAYMAKVTAVKGDTIKMTVYNKDYTGVKNVEYKAEGFAEGDYVLVYPNATMTASAAWSTADAFKGKILDVEAADDTVVGQITKVSTNNGKYTALTVDGASYDIATDDLSKMGINEAMKATDYDFENEFTLFLNNGYVVGMTAENVVTNIDDIVYVTKTTDSSGKDEYGNTINYVQVVHLDGTVELIKSTDTSAKGISTAGFYELGTEKGQTTFTAVSGFAAIDNKDVYYNEDSIKSALEMKTTTTSVEVTDNSKAYITDSTRIVFVSNDGKANCSATVATGAIAQTIDASSKVLLSKTKSGNYEVEAIIVLKAQINTANAVYVSGSDTDIVYVNGDEYNTRNIWDVATGEKTEVPLKTGYAGGFAIYSEDKDGLYSFTDIDAAAGKDNEDGVYTVSKDDLTLYNDLLSTKNLGVNINDLDASEAVVIWAGKGQKSLAVSDLVADEVKTLTAYILVDDEKVVAIGVSEYELKES